MNNFCFRTPVNVYFGRDSLRELVPLVEKHTNKVMLVYGGGSVKTNGAYASVTAALAAGSISWVDFGGNKEPFYEKVTEAIAICQDEQVGCVIGIGGCTCMDMAKIIAFGARNNDLWDFLSGKQSAQGKEHLLIGVILTYPSGGSEVDEAAEIDNLQTGDHGTLLGVYADFSILNPEFSMSLDRKNIAYAAMVTFVQASICHLGGCSAISEAFTQQILSIVQSSAADAISNPDNYEARANQMWASALTTMGILSCGKDKSWAWSIYNDLELIRLCMKLTYREAITVMFPRWLKAISVRHGEDVRRYMVAVMGVVDNLPIRESIDEGVTRIINLFTELGLPMTYNEFGEIPTSLMLRDAADDLAEESDLTTEEMVTLYLDCMP